MFLYGLFFISNIFDYISDYKKVLKLRLLCKEFNHNIIYFLKVNTSLPVILPKYVTISNFCCMNCKKKESSECIQFEDFFNMEDKFLLNFFVSCKHWECKFKIIRSYLFYLFSKNIIISNINYQNIRVLIEKYNQKKGLAYINNENFLILKDNKIQIKTFWYDKTTPHHYYIKNIELFDLYNKNKYLPSIDNFRIFSFYPIKISNKYKFYLTKISKLYLQSLDNAIYFRNSNKKHYFSEYYFSPFMDNEIQFNWLIQWTAYKKAKFKHNNVCIYKILSSINPENIDSLIEDYLLNHTMINKNEIIIRGNILKLLNNKNMLKLINNKIIIDLDDKNNRFGKLIMQAVHEINYYV